MRSARPVFLLRASLVCLAAGALNAQVQVSLGAGAGCNALQGGQTCTLTARVTGAANFNVAWTFNPIVMGAVLGVPSVPDATGLSTDTYKAPNFITTRQTVTATATSVVDPSESASVLISLVPPTVSIQVTPATATVAAGQTQQFTAQVFGISQTGVTWSINPQVGSIDPNRGIYTAPQSITAGQKVSVIATSTFDPVATGTATVTLALPSITVSPAAVTLTGGQTQQFTALAAGIAPGVTWSINPQV
ncbi:MAG TPA: Ig-like domain-containing protein, partial [Bryobacteraceae bacterium]|nr:Ig-like domain-containing protein [Bryobacteraceae bacterium]